MRKIFIVICCVFAISACNSNSVSKPDNLIDKDKMVEILYDISLLEAIKAQNINGGVSTKTSTEYIYKKYKIDSLQFVKSNKYYASHIEDYKKMIQEVKDRLTKETTKVEETMKKSGQAIPSSPAPVTPVNSDTPIIQ